MFKYLVVLTLAVLASWSVATASHAGFSINLPGFGLHLPLPGASINIGLPFAGPPARPVYYDGARYGYRDYDRYDRYDGRYRRYDDRGRYYGDRQSYYGPHHGEAPGYYEYNQGSFAEDGRTGFYGGRE